MAELRLRWSGCGCPGSIKLFISLSQKISRLNDIPPHSTERISEQEGQYLKDIGVLTRNVQEGVRGSTPSGVTCFAYLFLLPP